MRVLCCVAHTTPLGDEICIAKIVCDGMAMKAMHNVCVCASCDEGDKRLI